MFGKKKEVTALDNEQRELFENAQQRIREKRGLFTHFIVFVVGTIGLIIISQVLIKGEPPMLLQVQWWIWVLFIWLLLFIYHAFKVFVTNRLLGPEWEKGQYAKLVAKQQERMGALEKQVSKEYQVPDTKIESAAPAVKKELTMIAAAGTNNELGKDGDLVWRLPDDFKRFKELTTGHYIIMGRKTFESFPKPLPNRTHVILTKDPVYNTDGGIVVHDLQTAIATCSSDPNPFVIGGGEIYKLAMDAVTKIELTRVHGTFNVDTYFPAIDKNQFKLQQTVHHPIDERHAFAFDFETWVRI
jgi:dihydrofolate reductase